MRPLSAREQRLVALGILVGLVAGIWLLLLSPALDGFLSRSAERQSLQTRYARNERVLATMAVWKRQAMAQERTAAQFAFPGATKPIAVQQLQQRFTRSVSEVGGVLRSATPVEATSSTGIKLRADTELTMQQLYQLLKRLHSEQPYVVVEYLSIAANRAFETGHVGPMDVRLQLAASYRATGSQ